MRMMKFVLAAVIAVCVGAVDAWTTDLALVEGNLGATSCVWNAETLLSPSLSLAPPRKTVVAGAEIIFTASKNTNAVSWFMTDNRSGAALGANGALTARYSAGSTSDCVDVVEVWDGVNSFGRGYVNIISPAEVARCGKAVVLAGRASSTDPLWPSTRYLANMGYNALRYRGYSRENIQYLRPVPGADVDGDGLDNDIAAPSTLANAASTFTNWVSNADSLFVYLVDHGGASGGEGYFRLNPNETLAATQLDNWLDVMQDRYTNDVVVVIDCCNSGSFLPKLAYEGVAKRIVLAACRSDEPTVFVAGGLVSFSEAFFSGLMRGLSIGEAFAFAKAAMSAYQTSQLDDNKDGESDTRDGALAAATTVGASFVAGKDVPQIGLVLGNQQLTGDTVATLWASDVVAGYPIARVWCLIVPPGHQPDPADPVMDLPQLDLSYNPSTGRYEAQYAGFSEEGTYKVVYYAKDVWDSVSQPRQSYVVQSGFQERVIIVAGGTTEDSQWTSVANIADYGYNVFRERRLNTNAIHYLSQTLSPNVNGLSSRADFMNAVTNWAKWSNKLTLHLIAASAQAGGEFPLNATESITPSEIDGLLDAYQVSNATVTVIMDFNYSGSWVPPLAAPNRVSIASTSAASTAIITDKGRLSFSWCFLAKIQAGDNVWDAFKSATKTVLQPSRRRQVPQLDSTADGLFKEGFDQKAAKILFLGSAFMTGADVPTVEAVTPDTVLGKPATLTLWASGVADIGGVSNVFCLVTSPSYDGLSDAIRADLSWDPSNERFEVDYEGFTESGIYGCTYYVTDSDGQLSAPLQTLVEVLDGDGYEPDDSPATATIFEVGVVQTHNLHASNDVDWVKFYAPSGYVFNVQATQLGTNSDLIVEVYHEGPDGTLALLADSDWELSGEGLQESVEIFLSGEYQDPVGFYFVRVLSADETLWGAGSDYEMIIYSEQGADESVIVVAIDKLNPGSAPPGAVVLWDGGNSRPFGSANSLLLTLPPGVHSLRVTTPPGYIPEEDPALPHQIVNPFSYWYGNPKQTVSVSGSPRMAVFQFVPVTAVSGRTLNRFTGEPLAGAQLAFRAAGGPLNGLTYDGYPNNATYKTPWRTGPDGSFPTNVWLPTAVWNLAVSRPSFTSLAKTSAVPAMSAGSTTNLGALLLSPVDLNANGVADEWEARHKLANVTDGSDADEDGSPDKSEYLAGTDPTNSLSRFQILDMAVSPESGQSLRWNAVGGRSYRVHWADALGGWSSDQSVLAGPTNAWHDVTTPMPSRRFYRLGVELPRP